jgi:hypothetical protein
MNFGELFSPFLLFLAQEMPQNSSNCLIFSHFQNRQLGSEPGSMGTSRPERSG